MNYRTSSDSYHRPGGSALFAFLAGVSTAMLIGGYYLFGPNGQRNRMKTDRWIRRVRYEILQKMDALEDITEQQYHKIVDDVLSRYHSFKEISKEKMDRVSEDFRGKWLEMREAARRAKEEARTELEDEERERESAL